MESGVERQATNEETAIAEEYRSWKKNSAFLYDFILARGLVWPSLTIQWLPLSETPSGADYSIQKLILGTHTSDNEPNYLMIAQAFAASLNLQVRIPVPLSDDASEGEEGTGFGAASKDKKFKIETEIPHQGEVNRARYMPAQYNVIATSTVSGEVHVFDYFKHPTKPGRNDQPRPELILAGLSREGYGLAWNPNKRGTLMGSGNDGKICVWDIEGATAVNAKADPLSQFEGHAGAVEDVGWHKLHPEIFASVGDDRKLNIWDSRKAQPLRSFEAHSKDVLSLDFNPFNEHLLATASADRTVALWDLRNLSSSLHRLEQHKGEVLNVSWAPFKESVLASASSDRRVLVWDLAKVGTAQSPEDAKEGPPELRFVHGGHTSKIMDISWNLYEEYVLASVSFDNDIQIWQIVWRE